jgi:hypothetical protein
MMWSLTDGLRAIAGAEPVSRPHPRVRAPQHRSSGAGVGAQRSLPGGDRRRDEGDGPVRDPRPRGVRRDRDRRRFLRDRLRGDLPRLDGHRGHLGLALACHLDAGQVRNIRSAQPMAPRACNGGTTLRHRADRTRRGQRPAGHLDRRPAGGRPLRGRRRQDVDHQRAPCRPASRPRQDRPAGAATPPRHVDPDDRGADARFQRRQRPRQARLQGHRVG